MEKKIFSSLKNPDKLIYLVVLLSLIGSIVFFFLVGPTTLSDSDDEGYLFGGQTFAQYGYLAVWDEFPTAMIMPAMAVITGFAAVLFGTGPFYIISIKLLFIFTVCWTPLFFYRACKVFIPKWYALIASLVFLYPTHLWANGLILTEAPYLMFSIMCLYYTFKMGESKERKWLIRYCISFVLALSFRANIVVMPVFTWIYLLLIRKYSYKELLKSFVVLFLASMVLILPWTIRNYIRFQAFIPLTCGTGNPLLLGTYEGFGYPLDEELDYETYAIAPFMEDYGHYFNEDGSLKDPLHRNFIGNVHQDYRVTYRISEWIKRDLGSFLYSYLIYKPMSMINWVWYWGPGEALVMSAMSFLGKINLALCATGFILSLILKKHREIIIFLGSMYVINTYTLATATVTARYASMNLPLRYMIAGIALWLIAEAIIKVYKNSRTLRQ